MRRAHARLAATEAGADRRRPAHWTRSTTLRRRAPSTALAGWLRGQRRACWPRCSTTAPAFVVARRRRAARPASCTCRCRCSSRRRSARHALPRPGVDTLVAAAPLAAPMPALPGSRCASAGWRWRARGCRRAAVRCRRAPRRSPSPRAPPARPRACAWRAAAMHAVADGLAQALAPLAIARHLDALPLRGAAREHRRRLTAPRAAGASVRRAAAGRRSASTARRASTRRGCTPPCERHAAHSLILLPQMLRAWCGWLAAARPARAGRR
ncbi:MAG: hypothetical protein MZW92_55430 [Comamonadaceae bacterium]|nr:hypothetical protein [Comamonadaceae bacterium]